MSLKSVRRRPSQASPKKPGRLFAALGDDTRLGLVIALSSAGPMSITRLKAGTTVSRQAVRKHLQILEDAGIARSSKVGRERVWELNPTELDEARRSLDQISARWDAALCRLKTFVEES